MIMRHSNIYRLRSIGMAICIGVVIVIACNSPTPTVTNSTKSSISIEEGENTLPCWQGLCPGQMISAQTVIYRLYEIGIKKATFTNDIGVVDFVWNNRLSGQEVKGSIRIDGVKGSKDIDGLLRTIDLELLFGITIGQFFDKYGEPDCIYANQNGFKLIFNSVGTYVKIVLPTMKVASISQTMIITSIHLYEAGTAPECVPGKVDNSMRSRWVGFGVYE
jgi:hypothetical protein